MTLALSFAACASSPPPASQQPPQASPSGRVAPTAGPHPAELAPILGAIRAERMHSDVERLASFGTRHTLSETASPTRGIGAARRWIQSELARVPGVQVTLEQHTVLADQKRLPRDTEIVDVVGLLPGAMPQAAARRYYVVAHYDSRAADVMDADHDAPGANDDASGVAVVLELARTLSAHPLDATLVFLTTAGEEQGLHGAKAHAHAAREQHLDVRAVLNDDIVGDPSDPAGGRHDNAIRVFSAGVPPAASAEEVAEIRKLGAESDSGSRELARFVAEVARTERLELEPRLVFRADRFLRSGDQAAFLEEGFPAAIRFTTVAETFTRQHADVHLENGKRLGDLPEFVSGDYLAKVARLEAAVLVHLANAPSSPPHALLDTSALANDTLVRWEASPEPDVAGYEVVWRDTTEPEWSHVTDAGNRLEARLPISKDDFLVGVRAYDRAGWRSPVTFARAH